MSTLNHTKRGGPHNRGKTLVHNTSGLNTIRFRDAHGTVYVCSSWIDAAGRQRQCSISVAANGKRVAVKRAIKKRAAAAFPVPSVASALRALERHIGGER